MGACTQVQQEPKLKCGYSKQAKVTKVKIQQYKQQHGWCDTNNSGENKHAENKLYLRKVLETCNGN